MTAYLQGWHSAVFESNLGRSGAGVVHIHGEWLSGEDGAYRYRGRVSSVGGLAKGRIVVTRKAASGTSVFGPVERFVLVISGSSVTGQWEYSGHVLGAEHLRLRFRLKRFAQLAAE